MWSQEAHRTSPLSSLFSLAPQDIAAIPAAGSTTAVHVQQKTAENAKEAKAAAAEKAVAEVEAELGAAHVEDMALAEAMAESEAMAASLRGEAEYVSSRERAERDLFNVAQTPLPADEPTDFPPWMPSSGRLLIPSSKFTVSGKLRVNKLSAAEVCSELYNLTSDRYVWEEDLLPKSTQCKRDLLTSLLTSRTKPVLAEPSPTPEPDLPDVKLDLDTWDPWQPRKQNSFQLSLSDVRKRWEEEEAERKARALKRAPWQKEEAADQVTAKVSV